MAKRPSLVIPTSPSRCRIAFSSVCAIDFFAAELDYLPVDDTPRQVPSSARGCVRCCCCCCCRYALHSGQSVHSTMLRIPRAKVWGKGHKYPQSTAKMQPQISQSQRYPIYCRSAATPRRFSRCCHCQERHRQTPRQGVEARGPITIPCVWLIGLHATSPSRTASRPGTDLNVGRCGGQSETRDRRQASATHAVTRPSIHVHLLVPRPGARVQAPLDVWLLRALSRSLRRSNPVPTSQPSKERGAPWSERCGTTARSQGLRRTEVACKPTSRRPQPLRAAQHHPHLAHGPPSCRAPSRQGG